jgi:Na+(H+)/acetate symporter ActP
MWMFVLWWAVDDHLAAALETPGLGHLPIWVPFIIAIAFSTTLSVVAKGK